MPRNISISAASLAVLSITLASCSTQNESPKETPNNQSSKNRKLMGVEDTCEGIFDKQITAEVEENARHKRVHSALVEGYTKSATELTNQKDTWGGVGYKLCNLKDEKGAGLAEIDVIWTSHHVPGGKPFAYALGSETNYSSRLEVGCILDEHPISREYALQFKITDSFPMSTYSHTKLLTKAASKVISKMDCRDRVVFPEPDSVTSPPEPEETTGKVAR
ncbi:hypothetical protein [Streptomyces sp. Z26]|uniref:hypothetical protein n=1 Tax=Streptomyces sp. Z26 TaxID=2500177 RepID=UPI000FC99A42|nr:hypothetical protein [Streptomyces sp. Z26]